LVAQYLQFNDPAYSPLGGERLSGEWMNRDWDGEWVKVSLGQKSQKMLVLFAHMDFPI